MIERVPVPLPVRGLADVGPTGEQPEGTTMRARNVRGVDPITGRVRLSQRSGLKRDGKGLPVVAGSRPMRVFSAARDTPPEEWVELTDTDAASVVPTAVEATWELDLGAGIVAMARGIQGNAFVLLETGEIAVLSDDGKKMASAQIQVPNEFRLVRSLAVDAEDAVFAVCEADRRFDGGAGRIYRFVKSGDDWVPAYVQTVEWSPRLVEYDAGDLFLVTDRPDDWDLDGIGTGANPDGPAERTRLERYVGASGAPSLAWTSAVPGPVNALAFNPAGEVLVASGANPSRDPGLTPSGTVSVDWVPADAVAGTDGMNATEAYYWHVDALYAQQQQGIAAGQRDHTGGRILDCRKFALGSSALFDDTPRDLYVRRNTEYDFETFSGAPAFKFFDDPAITEAYFAQTHTRRHATPALKERAQDPADWSRSIFPAMVEDQSSGATDAKWAMTHLFRVEATRATGERQVLLHHGGWLLTYEENGSGGVDVELLSPGAGSALTATLAGSLTQTIMVTLVHAGNGVAGSLWRVNGTTIDSGLTWTMGFDTDLHTFIAKRAIDVAAPSPTVYPAVGAWAGGTVMLGGTTTTPHDTVPGAASYERVEGYFAHGWGSQAILPGGHTYKASPPVGGGSVAPSTTGGVNDKRGQTGKYSRTEGRIIWNAVGSGSHGNGVASGVEGEVFTAGSPDPGLTSGLFVRLNHDEGDSVLSTGATVWAQGGTMSPGRWARSRVTLLTDSCGDCYVPWSESDTAGRRAIMRLKREGNGVGGAEPVFTFDHDDAGTAYPLALLPGGLDVTRDEDETEDPCGFEFLFAAYSDQKVRRVEVLGRKRTGATRSREIDMVAVTSDGAVSRKGTDGTWTSMASAVFTGPYVWNVSLFQKTIIGDGSRYRVYDHEHQKVTALEPEGKGKVPPRCQLGVLWNGRAVLARGDNPSAWNMSAKSNLLDWDTAPEVVTETSAVSGISSQVGDIPDIVNALIPWSDDLLIFGCDASVWRLTGDPMGDGQLHRVSDQHGFAFGSSWCKDPEGTIYAFSSRGGVYAMAPGGGPVSLTEGRIQKRLEAVDLKLWRIELAWNFIDNGLHVFLIPTGGLREAVHYFWERATGGWWEDEFSSLDLAVSSVAEVSGDNIEERELVIAGWDGRLRRWDALAPTDDGHDIKAHALVGSVVTSRASSDYRLTSAEVVTARGLGSVQVAATGSGVADIPAHPERWATVRPGERKRVGLRARGSHLWIHFASSGADGGFALEELAVNVTGAGRKRMRA